MFRYMNVITYSIFQQRRRCRVCIWSRRGCSSSRAGTRRPRSSSLRSMTRTRPSRCTSGSRTMRIWSGLSRVSVCVCVWTVIGKTYRVSTIKVHTLNVNKVWWLWERRTLDMLLERTKNMCFFIKSFGRQLHNLCLIILKIPILTTWITGSKKSVNKLWLRIKKEITTFL